MRRDNQDGSYAKEIREPRITSRYYIRLSNLSKLLRKTIQNHLVQGENRIILDLGCGDKPYQPFFDGRTSFYVGVDINPNSLADVVACGEHLPFKDGSFDACLCTQTYEHVADPEQVTREIDRVLNKRGVLFLSVPGTIPVHNYPHDYWRWTDQGLRMMLTKHFSLISVHEVCTPLETISQLALTYLPTSKFSSFCTAFTGKLMDLFGKNFMNTKFPRLIGTYLAVARKEQRLLHTT
jgi:SAM-dependent methyltransferase